MRQTSIEPSIFNFILQLFLPFTSQHIFPFIRHCHSRKGYGPLRSSCQRPSITMCHLDQQDTLQATCDSSVLTLSTWSYALVGRQGGNVMRWNPEQVTGILPSCQQKAKLEDDYELDGLSETVRKQYNEYGFSSSLAERLKTDPRGCGSN